MQEKALATISINDLIAEYAAYKEPKVTIDTLRRCVNNLKRYVPEGVSENWRTLPKRLDLAIGRYAGRTRRNKICDVRGFLDFLVIFHGLDPRAPHFLSLPRLQPVMPSVLSWQQCRTVVRGSWQRPLDERLYVLLCMYHGLRRSEALALHREDIDLIEGVVRLRWRPGFRLKTESSSRPIPIPAAVQPFIEELIADKARGRVLPYCPEWTKTHAPYSRSELEDDEDPPSFKVGSMILRHTYASALISGRVRDGDGKLGICTLKPDYWQVSRLLGHKGVNTLRHYVGLSDGVPGLDPAELAARPF